MMTVRFDTGFSVQYNNAMFVLHGSDNNRLYTKKGGSLLAVVPVTAIVELVAPCRTYNPVTIDSNRVQASVDLLAKDVRSLKRKLGK